MNDVEIKGTSHNGLTVFHVLFIFIMNVWGFVIAVFRSIKIVKTF